MAWEGSATMPSPSNRLWPWVAALTLMQTAWLLLQAPSLTPTSTGLYPPLSGGEPSRSPAVEVPTWALEWSCPSAHHVIYGGEWAALFFAPLIVQASALAWFTQIVCIAYLALVEERLARSHVKHPVMLLDAVLAFIFLPIIRLVTGYMFSRMVGWSHPSFFFSDAAHECGTGLLPALIVLVLAWDAYLREDSYNIVLGANVVQLSASALHLVILTPLVLINGVIWWGIAALIVGLVLAPLSIRFSHGPTITFRYERKLSIPREAGYISGRSVSSSTSTSSPSPSSNTLVERLAPSANIAALVAILLFTSALFQQTNPDLFTPNDERILSLRGSRNSALATFTIVSAPRPGNPNYLERTISSLLDEFPTNDDALHGLFRIVVFTSFEEYPLFLSVKETLDARYPGFPSTLIELAPGEEMDFSNKLDDFMTVVWIRAPPTMRLGLSARQQRIDFATAIKASRLVSHTLGGSAYQAIIEDDFPLCDYGWRDFLRVLHLSQRDHPDHCALFVGTGGSGLIWRSEMTDTLIDLLLEGYPYLMSTRPTDLIIQDCLRGLHPRCTGCAYQMVTSTRLLMHHLGFNTSTGPRVYTSEMWQCGWRHPFNGEPDVITL